MTSRNLVMEGCWNLIFKTSCNTNLFMIMIHLLSRKRVSLIRKVVESHLTQAALLATFLGWEGLNLQ